MHRDSSKLNSNSAQTRSAGGVEESGPFSDMQPQRESDERVTVIVDETCCVLIREGEQESLLRKTVNHDQVFCKCEPLGNLR